MIHHVIVISKPAWGQAVVPPVWEMLVGVVGVVDVEVVVGVGVVEDVEHVVDVEGVEDVGDKLLNHF